MLTKNSEKTLTQTLESLKTFAEVIVLDTGSTDKTLEIASQFSNVSLHKAPMTGFGDLHNKAASLSSHDWILSIDSDEVLSDELVKEIHALALDPIYIYAIRRDNYFNGKKMRCCAGWHPDWVARLYNREKTQFSSDAVHEKVIGCKVIQLRCPMKHVPYRSSSDFLSKMQTYSTLFALQHRGKKKSSLTKAILHSLAAFCKNYFLCRGILGGREGFVISLYNAQTTYYKYLKLAELNAKKDCY
jgi:glycosyltransferase involved in cell wall biosynthesis